MDAPTPPDPSSQPLHPPVPATPRPDLPPLPRSVADSARSQWARRSVTLKLAGIVVMTLVLMVPLLMLQSLIRDRERLRDTAREELAAKWGGAQRLGGPVLTIPLTRPAGTRPDESAPEAVHLLPDDLAVTGTLAPEVRRRGLYRVVLYTSRLDVRARFPKPDLTGLDLKGGTPDFGRAYVQLGIPDMAGVKEAVVVNWNGQPREASPGIPTSEVFRSGVHVPVAVSGDSAQTFETRLVLGGAQSLRVLPFGKTTTVELRGPWSNTAAVGSFLADTIALSPQGFTARWKVLHLNRNYGQRIAGRFPDFDPDPSVEVAPSARYGGADVGTGRGSSFGVELLEGVDGYRKSQRSAEYGLLFILLTFATFFFVEVLGGRRVHPVQYLLVGFAVSLFYLLLVAFSEYMAFDAAYLTAALAILALVLLYTKAVFRSWRTAGLIAGILAAFYLYFYVLLTLEDYALLAGAIGLFVILAAIMYLSRRVDWYGLAGGEEAPVAVTTA